MGQGGKQKGKEGKENKEKRKGEMEEEG